jgi:hypothetical protein
MKNIKILAEHSTLGLGPLSLPVEQLERVNKLIQIQNSWPWPSQIFLQVYEQN